MLQLTPHMRLLVCVEPIDFRKGIDGLVRICRETLAEDPFRGTVFVFRNRRATAVKVLAYDGQGFWLCQNGCRLGGLAGGPKVAPARHSPRTNCTCCYQPVTRGA